MKLSKWELYCIIVAVFQPILGLIGGYVLYTDGKYKTTGKIVIVFSVLWLVVLIALGYYFQKPV